MRGMSTVIPAPFTPASPVPKKSLASQNLFWEPYFSLLFGEVAHHAANAADETEGVTAGVSPSPPCAAVLLPREKSKKTFAFPLKNSAQCSIIVVYCKGTVRTTLLAASFGRLAVHRLCNTAVLLHPLHGKASQNLLAKSAKQSKAAVLPPDKARTAGRAERTVKGLNAVSGQNTRF